MPTTPHECTCNCHILGRHCIKCEADPVIEDAPTMKSTNEWEKTRNYIVKMIHDLVESETCRVHELTSGAVRRDGGRQMNEEIVIKRIIETVHELLSQAIKEAVEGERNKSNSIAMYLGALKVIKSDFVKKGLVMVNKDEFDAFHPHSKDEITNKEN